MNKEKVLENLNDHFSRWWNFNALKTKPHIKFKFKENKKKIRGRIILDEGKIKYKIFDDVHTYSYPPDDRKHHVKFLDGMMSLHPIISQNDKDFDDWIREFKKHKRKRNKPARKLYGYEK